MLLGQNVAGQLETLRGRGWSRASIASGRTTRPKLEQMRQTVDEKLHATFEQRLSESFKQVFGTARAGGIKGLGEMQILATGVGGSQSAY